MTSSARITAAPAVRRGRPPKTDGNDVTRAALEIADVEGLGALSMRRLADHLGVAVTTVYNHVTNKEDLIDRLRVFTLSALDVDPSSTLSWREQLFSSIVGVYHAFREHPSGIELLLSTPAILEPAFRRLADRLVGILTDQGFSTEEAAATIEALLMYAASVANHERVQTRRTDDLAHEAEGCTDTSRLDLIEHARSLARPIPVEVFETGLRGSIDAFGAKYGRG